MKNRIGFRSQENTRTIAFITEKTDIPREIIDAAVACMPDNDFHNKDHMLFATRAAIEIGMAEFRYKPELNLLALTMLFHDAHHPGVATPTDEMQAFKIAFSMIPTEVLGLCRTSKFQNLDNALRDCIMASCFSMRGKISDPLLRIIQDADIHHCAVSPVYWMYLCSGTGLEMAKQFNKSEFTNPLLFFKGGDDGGQRSFVSFLESITNSENILLSEGAKHLWTGEARVHLREIESWSDARLSHAFNLRKEDLTLAEYEASVLSIF